jgi:hypothetical protein
MNGVPRRFVFVELVLDALNCAAHSVDVNLRRDGLREHVQLALVALRECLGRVVLRLDRADRRAGGVACTALAEVPPERLPVAALVDRPDRHVGPSRDRVARGEIVADLEGRTPGFQAGPSCRPRPSRGSGRSSWEGSCASDSRSPLESRSRDGTDRRRRRRRRSFPRRLGNTVRFRGSPAASRGRRRSANAA